MRQAIDQERRFSDTLLRLDLDPNFVDRILDLALEYENAECMSHGASSGSMKLTSLVASKSIDEPEEKVILRLAITYGVLRRLGFAESRVEECLRAIGGVDMDEAFEWV